MNAVRPGLIAGPRPPLARGAQSLIRPHLRSAGVVAAVVIAADLVTKALAFAFAAGRTSGPVVPVTNPELLLGAGSGSAALMVVISLAGIVSFGGYLVRSLWRGSLPTYVPGFLIGGSTANLVDRVATGAVHDFIATPWIVLNLADVAVLVGVVGYLMAAIRTPAAAQR